LPEFNPVAAVIATNLRLASRCLRDARLTNEDGSRYASNYLFTATELTLLAVLASEGRFNVYRSTQHRLDEMTDGLPDENQTKAVFRRLEGLTDYATTFRYGTQRGRIKAGMGNEEFVAKAKVVEELISWLAKHFGVSDLGQDATTPAARTEPPRRTEPEPAERFKPKG
jgi:hypothetical protein